MAWTEREIADRIDAKVDRCEAKIDRIERQISYVKDLVFVCWIIQTALITYVIFK